MTKGVSKIIPSTKSDTFSSAIASRVAYFSTCVEPSSEESASRSRRPCAGARHLTSGTSRFISCNAPLPRSVATPSAERSSSSTWLRESSAFFSAWSHIFVRPKHSTHCEYKLCVSTHSDGLCFSPHRFVCTWKRRRCARTVPAARGRYVAHSRAVSGPTAVTRARSSPKSPSWVKEMLLFVAIKNSLFRSAVHKAL